MLEIAAVCSALKAGKNTETSLSAKSPPNCIVPKFTVRQSRRGNHGSKLEQTRQGIPTGTGESTNSRDGETTARPLATAVRRTVYAFPPHGCTYPGLKDNRRAQRRGGVRKTYNSAKFSNITKFSEFGFQGHSADFPTFRCKIQPCQVAFNKNRTFPGTTLRGPFKRLRGNTGTCPGNARGQSRRIAPPHSTKQCFDVVGLGVYLLKGASPNGHARGKPRLTLRRRTVADIRLPAATRYAQGYGCGYKTYFPAKLSNESRHPEI